MSAHAFAEQHHVTSTIAKHTPTRNYVKSNGSKNTNNNHKGGEHDDDKDARYHTASNHNDSGKDVNSVKYDSAMKSEPTTTNCVFTRPKKCRFRFCDGKRLIVVGKNDRALTSAICSKKYGMKIGSVDETGEAYLVNKYRTRISRWAPSGLKQPFARSFFKAYTIRGKNQSGVGHEVAQQNQAKYLHRKCWILPLKAYQVWDTKTGGWVENYGKDPFVDCISFCTVTKKRYH